MKEIIRYYGLTSGTTLPISVIKGQEYLEVKWRLVWFREDHSTWPIETEFLVNTEKFAFVRATVRDETGRAICTAHKSESIDGFFDFREKAETGAIGRALALIGYGTQFCGDELDEGERLADSPVEPKKPISNDPPRALSSTSQSATSKETPAPPAKENYCLRHKRDMVKSKFDDGPPYWCPSCSDEKKAKKSAPRIKL